VFIIVAVHAQIFPVRPVRGIVVVIPVFVVHREEVSCLEVELSGALGTDEPVNLQRLFPVSAIAGGGRFWSQSFEYLVNRFIDCGLLETSQFVPTPVGISHGVYPFKRWRQFLFYRL
jgi:hypothetical protein